jgi:hypothetical protein
LKYIKDKKEEDLYQEKNNNKEFVLHKK